MEYTFKHTLNADMLYNRLRKRYKHIGKWARRCGIYAYRLYDKDIPEFPIIVDLYIEHITNAVFIVLTLYESPHIKRETDSYLHECAHIISEALHIDTEAFYLKMRKRQKGSNQYEKLASMQKRIIVKEGTCLFFINLSDYLDTGLFLDHRPTRLMLADSVKDKTVLNLFCYTAAFSVHALAGGAKHVCSVDLSKNYLQWAQENIRLNHLNQPDKSELIHSDVRIFLKNAQKKRQTWDIIICDPPTFSNSKRTSIFFDINRDWHYLIRDCCAVLAKQGILYFSTNSKKLYFDIDLLSDEKMTAIDQEAFLYNGHTFLVQDISRSSIPEDFRNKKIHRLWKITRTH